MSEEYVVVTTISQFRMRYVMHKDDLQKLNPDTQVNPIEWAEDTVTCEECDDFSQRHLGEVIIDAKTMSEEEMLDLFNTDNNYLSSWSDEYKIKWTRKLLEAEQPVPNERYHEYIKRMYKEERQDK